MEIFAAGARSHGRGEPREPARRVASRGGLTLVERRLGAQVTLRKNGEVVDEDDAGLRRAPPDLARDLLQSRFGLAPVLPGWRGREVRAAWRSPPGESPAEGRLVRLARRGTGRHVQPA